MKNNNITIIRYVEDKNQTVIDTANYLGKIIDSSFTASNRRFEEKKGNVDHKDLSERVPNPHGHRNKTTMYDIRHYFFKPSQK